jgi:DNA (cytosine-5)-methyltransferase 1
MWPEAVRAVRDLTPKAFLFENVRGLLRPAFQDYFAYLKLSLSWPEIPLREAEDWRDHAIRLAGHRDASADRPPSYRVLFRAINTADYGAHQKRHRAMAIGLRSDVSDDWAFPNPTHSREALIWDQHISAGYWSRHGLNPAQGLPCVGEHDKVVATLRQQLVPPAERPWLTVRDAIGDLPEPALKNPVIDGHKLHPGARTYPRHTGSRWDEPAKALKAGDHGVPGGENILVQSDGTVRYFTLREMARLQGLPDDFHVPGTWKAPIKQLGNAVPVQVGEVLGSRIKAIITGASVGTLPVAA